MNEIRDILYRNLLAFLTSSALLWMAANAVLGTAPATLPAWRDLPQWMWTWAISAARQFASLHGGHIQPAVQPGPDGQKANQ
jgi:hypothetical protein